MPDDATAPTPSHPEVAGEPAALPAEYLEALTDERGFEEPAAYRGSVGRTMFDSAAAQDGSVTVLLPKEEIARVPLQSLVRVTSVGDGRRYLGIVVSGPFAEPDGLRADANVIVTTTVRGGIFMPRYHGRVQVEILGEETAGGRLVPPRFRPLPNSPVHVLSSAETAEVLCMHGELRLGTVLGDAEVAVKVPADRKSVLPRHLAVLGTTGGGKSTTVARLVAEAQRAGLAIVLLDTEGEYVHLDKPADDPGMVAALRQRGLDPVGIPGTRLYHLVGTETANPQHPRRQAFDLEFTALSPYTVAEVVGMSDAQQERFFRAIDVTKQVLRDLKIFPATPEEERQALEVNEFEEGYPRLTFSRLIDVVKVAVAVAEGADPARVQLYDQEFRSPAGRRAILQRVQEAKPSHAVSWRATLSRLWRLYRMGIFDQPNHRPINYQQLLRPGQVSIVDLSDTDSPAINNIVIADMLRRIQRAQDEAYRSWERGELKELRKVLIVIEEAHEFLSAERVSKMPVLFEQVARIAKRGRKRWLGMVFVTQLPQQLPREVLGLVNNYVLHKINDEGVLRALRNAVPGIDEALWRRLPSLAPGQAVVSFTHMARPLLAAVDPAPCRLRMVD